MAKVNLSKLAQEVDEKSKTYVGPKYVSRWGIHYAWFSAQNLDEGVRLRQKFALRWRVKLLALVGDKPCRVDKRTVLIRPRYAHTSSHLVTVYSIDGQDRLVVATRSRNVIEVNTQVNTGTIVLGYVVL